MGDANEKDEGPKSNSGPEKDLTQSVIAPSAILSVPVMNSESTVVASGDTNNMEEEGEEEEEEEEDDFEEEEDEEEDEEDEDEEEPEEEEMATDGAKSTIAVNNEGLDTEHGKGKAVGEETNKEIDAKEGNKKAEDPKGGDESGEKKAEDPKTGDEIGEKKVGDPKTGDELGEKKVGDPKTGDELGENSKNKGKRPRPRSRNQKKDPEKEPDTLAANGDKPESSNKKKAAPKASAALAANGDKPEPFSKKKGPKRVESMGMVFMCTSKTKADCFRYKVLGLPGNKKDQVAKIYKGMRLFLFDVDLRLMYGIFKAAGPGGYNLEPKAFKADFPSQVRFTVLDDCLPLAEEKFKDVIKENYYSRNKFEGLLKSEQVRKLCKLFVELGRGGSRSKAVVKKRRPRRVESPRARPVESRRSRADDLHTSRPREKRKRRAREEERRPRSPPHREKRRYTEYERERSPVLYERRSPAPRYLPPPRLPPPAIASPVRLYNYERPLDVPPYVHERVPEHHTYHVRDVEPRDRDRIPEHHTYRVLGVEPRDQDRSRERDPYHAYGREAPSYRDTVYTLPPEYHLVSRDYHPPAVQTSEYHLSGGSRVPGYRDAGPAIDYRPFAAPLPEYRSQTHYKY